MSAPAEGKQPDGTEARRRRGVWRRVFSGFPSVFLHPTRVVPRLRKPRHVAALQKEVAEKFHQLSGGDGLARIQDMNTQSNHRHLAYPSAFTTHAAPSCRCQSCQDPVSAGLAHCLECAAELEGDVSWAVRSVLERNAHTAHLANMAHEGRSEGRKAGMGKTG